MMTLLDWDNIKYFTPDEFPPEDGVFLNAAPGLILSLDQYRGWLGSAIYPSPVPGALARFDGSTTSRHYAVGRKSDAVDVFCNCPIFRAWTLALQSGLWGGIGVYFDTKFRGGEWPMLHLDKRVKRLIWWRDGEYRYPDNPDFWPGLMERLGRRVVKKS